MNKQFLNECLLGLEKELLDEIEKHSSVKTFSEKQYVVKEGEFIRFLPIVMNGNVKVFSDEESTPFLLYYISSGDPCIFSFAHLFNETPVEFSAITEFESELLLLPINKVNEWYKKYPSFCMLLLKAYQKHYNDLLNTTKQITCYNLEERLILYLQDRARIEKTDLLKIGHQDIADDLGTSREVISRLMKKIGKDKKVIQVGRKIKVL